MKEIVGLLILQVFLLINANTDEIMFARNVTLFSGNMYSRLNENNENQNIIFSPLSVYETLGMVLAGAADHTEAEMKEVMRLNQSYSDRKIHSLMAKLNRKVSSRQNGEELLVANAMFADYNFHIHSTYLSTLKFKYSAYFQNLNMTNKPEAKETINNWVDRNTKQKIKNLIDTIPDYTRLILVNGIYFKGMWETSFKAARNPISFTLTNGQTVDKVGMTLKSYFPYHVDIGIQVQFLAIPYSSPPTSYFVIGLPLPTANLTSFNKKAGQVLKSLPPVEQWNEEKFQLTMPKFKIEQNVNVKQILQEMGISDLFNSHSDLRGISRTPIYVSEFVHKAYIKVNEKGTEAAAASAAVLGARSFEMMHSIEVNQPFFFAIYNIRAKLYTFMGKINDPQL